MMPNEPTTFPCANARPTEEQDAVNPTEAVRAVTLKMFDRLFPLLIAVGTPTLALAIWRTHQFGRLPTIAAYVIVFLGIVAVIALRHRLPLWVVSAVICILGIADGIITLLSYSFASAGLLLLCLSTICAAVFFGLRGGLIVYAGSLLLSTVIAFIMCSGAVPLDFETHRFLRAPSAWASQLIHFALLTLLAMILVQTIQSRLVALLKTIHGRSTDLAATNEILKAEVTARMKAEEDLQRSEAQYRLLAAHMYDILFQQDPALNMVYVSPSVERLFGYTVEEAMRLRMTDIMTEGSLARAMQTYPMYLAQAEKGDVNVPLQEYEYVRKDGTTFWGELSVKFLKDDQGAPTGSLGVLRDISDRRRAQAEKERLVEQLRQSEKMEVLGRLAGGIAHDFNNQLAGIMGYAELLKSRKMGPDFEVQASEMITQCAKRAGDLTGKLLAFARKGAYRASPVDMHELIHEVAAILERSIDKTVAIVKTLTAPQSVVIGDATQLQNALLNLAVNARDAMPGGGELHFRSAVVDRKRAERIGLLSSVVGDEYIEIQVQDTGVGIDETALKCVFEPFYTTKETGRGTGMGLAAVHGTATAHNGAISVTSSPGVGTTFSLLLPLSFASTSPVTEPPISASQGVGRILLIEDELAVRRVVRLHLTSRGYYVESAQNGPSGIDIFNRQNGDFDLVLLDLILPRMDGATVFDALRALKPNIKILLLSGHSGNIAVPDLISRGAVDFVAKPFTLTALSNAVEKALSAKPPRPFDGKSDY